MQGLGVLQVLNFLIIQSYESVALAGVIIWLLIMEAIFSQDMVI